MSVCAVLMLSILNCVVLCLLLSVGRLGPDWVCLSLAFPVSHTLIFPLFPPFFLPSFHHFRSFSLSPFFPFLRVSECVCVLRLRLSPFTRATVPSWSDVIPFIFIETSKDDLEVRRSIFPAAHLTPLAVLYFQQI